MVPVVAAAGITALSAAGQAYAQGKTNKKTREWNEMMYGRQREDALNDWNRVNDYNSPQSQMERFKAAGLNPNLIYGQTNDAGPIRPAEAKSWTPEAPNVAGIGRVAMEGVRAYQDYTLQQEQIKNMETTRESMKIDQLLKVAELTSRDLKNAQMRELFDTSIEQANATLQGTKLTNQIKVSKEVRDAAMHAPTLEAALQKVANMTADSQLKLQQIQNLKNAGQLQQLEINMRKLGLSFSDSSILRMLATFAGGQSLPEVFKNLTKYVSSMMDELPEPKDVIKVDGKVVK